MSKEYYLPKVDKLLKDNPGIHILRTRGLDASGAPTSADGINFCVDYTVCPVNGIYNIKGLQDFMGGLLPRMTAGFTPEQDYFMAQPFRSLGHSIKFGHVVFFDNLGTQTTKTSIEGRFDMEALSMLEKMGVVEPW